MQGAFREHIKSIKNAGADAKEIRLPEQLKEIGGLIIPGGESTTINRLLNKYNFKEYLDNFYKSKKPIFGTCAGMILLAKKVVNEDVGLGYIDITVERNSYGRQIESFEEYIELHFNNVGSNNDDLKKFRAIFIRAPRIVSIGPSVEILAEIKDNIILAKEKNILVSSFHPELQEDLSIHKYFLDMVGNKQEEK